MKVRVLFVAALLAFLVPSTSAWASSSHQTHHKSRTSKSHNSQSKTKHTKSTSHKSQPTKKSSRTSHARFTSRHKAKKHVYAPAPTQLLISRIGVHSHVESLGLSNPSAVHAPYKWWDVAWWNRGPRPGSAGISLIFGHLDSTTGIAVFWYLKNLVRGNIITVVYPHNRRVYFRVVDEREYWDSQFPLRYLLSRNRAHLLALVTCMGVFHRGPGYDHRYVVLAQQV